MLARILDRSRRSLRRLHRDGRGNVLVLTAAAIPMLLGGAGLGVDVTQWYLWGRELQMGVDAGALAGTYSQAQGKDYSTSARSAVSTNLNVVTVTGTPTVMLGNWAGGTNNAVTVTAQTQRTLPFSGMFLSTAPTISRTATAAIIDSGTFCMKATHKTAQDAISIGGNALLQLGCGIVADSNNVQAINIFGSSLVDATSISAVGGITAGSGNLSGNTPLRPYSLPQSDPLANLPPPPNNGINRTTPNCNGNKCSGVTDLNPGIYANMDLNGSFNMKTGVYVLDSGNPSHPAQLSINAQDSLTGNGVIIVLRNNAEVKINGGSNVSLTALTKDQATQLGISTAYAGILIFQDAATSTYTESNGSVNCSSSCINGNATLHLGGTIYMPMQDIQITGNAAPSTQCLLLIASKIKISGNPIIPNSCPTGQNGYGIKVVRLVS